MEDTLPHVTCALTHQQINEADAVPLATLRPAVAALVVQDHPELDAKAVIARSEVVKYRAQYIETLLAQERGDLTELDRSVIDTLSRDQIITQNTDETADEKRNFGERMADHIAIFGGSWTFILTFLGLLLFWIAINIAQGLSNAFDPYPFILLNLVLSCIAALQAPVIMMSQRRQETKDRHRAENDYRVNLKAELEIRHLHDKFDHLIHKQWQKLTEVQAMQLELLHDLDKRSTP